MKHILRCKSCGSYSLSEKCKCGSECVLPKPAKFSPQDDYARYRREAKRKELEERGLI